VNLLNFLFNSVRIGPNRHFNNVITLRSFSCCTANSASVNCRGSTGGAIGSSSSTLRLRLTPSGNWLGGRCASARTGAKNSSRCSIVDFVISTRLSFVGPNQARTSRGRLLKGPSTTARSNTGSEGDRVSSMALTVDLEVSETVAHQPTSEGM
jgi:hypothetical protein